jgi:hypothetical protein
MPRCILHTMKMPIAQCAVIVCYIHSEPYDHRIGCKSVDICLRSTIALAARTPVNSRHCICPIPLPQGRPFRCFRQPYVRSTLACGNSIKLQSILSRICLVRSFFMFATGYLYMYYYYLLGGSSRVLQSKQAGPRI